MFDPLDVPGYDVLAPLGTGRSWKAIATCDRAHVVLRPVLGSDAVRRRLRQEAALWGSVTSAHVVAVRDVLSTEPDLYVVVSDYASGGGLDALLARRGGLTDGEIVTVVGPLAEALAAAHERGLAHGRVTAGNVVFTDDGRPMLTDAALSTCASGDAVEDVAALVRLARACLGDRRTGPVHEALAGAATSASDLAATLRVAVAARPVALHETRGATADTTVSSVRTRRHRPLLVVGSLIALALVVGVVSGRKDDAGATNVPQHTAPPTPMTTASSLPPEPWRGIVQRLERDRVKDYRTTLRRDGLRPVGLDLRLDSVALVSAAGDRAVVRVVDGWTAYELLGRDGHVVGRRPAKLHRVSTLVLQRTTTGWRVQRVLSSG